jgi:hypothetical protein
MTANPKTEGGHKRGHSNMTHYEPTSEVKANARTRRRQEDQRVDREWDPAVRDWAEPYGIDLDDFTPLPSAKDRVDPVEWAWVIRKVTARDGAILDALDDC